VTDWIKNVMTSLINSPLVLLQDDDAITSSLWYRTTKVAVCPKCLEKGKKNLSYGFYQDKCHECDTKMKPIKLNKDNKVIYGKQ